MKKEKLLSRGREIVLPWVVFANSVVCGISVVKGSWVNWSVSAGGENTVSWLALIIIIMNISKTSLFCPKQ